MGGQVLVEGKKIVCLWLNAIHREDLTEEKLENAAVHLNHFLTSEVKVVTSRPQKYIN